MNENNIINKFKKIIIADILYLTTFLIKFLPSLIACIICFTILPKMIPSIKANTSSLLIALIMLCMITFPLLKSLKIIFKTMKKIFDKIFIIINLNKYKPEIIKCMMKEFHFDEGYIKTKIEFNNENIIYNTKYSKYLNQEHKLMSTKLKTNLYEKILSGKESTECYLIILNNKNYLIYIEKEENIF